MPEPSDHLLDDLPTPDLVAAADTIETADSVIGKAVRHLAASGGPDVHQVLAYDLARGSAGRRGPGNARLRARRETSKHD